MSEIKIKIQQQEQELEALTLDNGHLTELRTKHEEDFAAAETAWRTSRSQADLDVMVRAKSQLDAVKDALLSQAVELAKSEAYLKTLRAEDHLDSGLAAVAEDQLPRLAKVQDKFGKRLRALQQHVVEELLALDVMRVEWDQLHQDSWGQLFGLGLTVEDVTERLASRELDVTPLRLRTLPTGDLNPAFETLYELPLTITEARDYRSTMQADIGRKLGGLLLSAQIRRDEEAYRQSRVEQDERRRRYRTGFQAQMNEHELGGISQAELSAKLLAEERAERIKMGRELPPEVPGEEE